MGSFANSLFTVLLGWLQGAVSAVWNAFTSEKGNSFLNWIGNNWILIAVVLCITGLAADLCVYLLRWKPMRVWKSFLTRDREEEEPMERRRTPAVQPKAYRRTFPQQPEEADTRPEPAKASEDPDLSQWEEEAKPAQPERTEKPATVTGAGYVVPQDSPYRRPAAEIRNAAPEPEKESTYRRTSETLKEAYRRPADEAEHPRRRTAEHQERVLTGGENAEKPEQKVPETAETPRRRTATREESVPAAEEKKRRSRGSSPFAVKTNPRATDCPCSSPWKKNIRVSRIR